MGVFSHFIYEIPYFRHIQFIYKFPSKFNLGNPLFPKESSLKKSSNGSYCFVAILLFLWFGNFDTPTTCAFIIMVGGW